MKFAAKIIPTLSLLAPGLALAQGQLTNVSTFVTNIVNFMNNTLVPFVFALAFLVFIWGMFKAFILGGSDPGKQDEGKQLMLWAIIGFVIMVSLWGIVNLFATGFGFGGQQIQQMPDLPTGQT